ncbi:protealysin inhibitor emfourin [Nocardioides zeicaulis]|uniref:Neutral metalloproteinase n=1 Tax=Nocardioides zeicaulis TaxID=1776857 RepID=A0ABV6DZQ3_9ACTN
MTTSRDLQPRCTFIPPWLADRVASAQVPVDRELRAARAAADRSARPALAGGTAAWTVHDAGSTTRLPGTPVRSAGQPATGDEAVDEAADGVTATLAMWAEGFGRDSFDGAGAPVSLTVHYGADYDNAFWDGTQLVFGDGDGRVFDRFTKPVDVLAHELGHAVVEHTCDLAYEGQSGALNESVADAFASCLKQRVLGQDAAAGDWLIGEGIFRPSVQARALRDMAAPGTAYDDPELGADPQVGHMDDYVDTTDDNGGVHLNSGIPNKAFQLAAVAIGGTSVEGAGQVWYAALTGGAVSSTADFAQFAAATVAAAGEHADAVAQAWAQVGVEPSAAGGASRPGPDGSAARTLRVERSGGFAGRTQSAEVDLDDPAAGDLRGLVDEAGIATLRAPADPTPKPDMFVYGFCVDGGDVVRVPEHLLTGAQAEVARRVLRTADGTR